MPINIDFWIKIEFKKLWIKEMFIKYFWVKKIMPPKFSKEVIAVDRARIKFKDNFHAKNLYYFMYDWLVQQAWEPRKDEEFHEIFIGQNESAPGGSELWWYWRPRKIVNEYIKWVLDINVHIILLRKVEIMKDGEKFKTNWGEVEIILKSRLQLDWKGKWQKHPILKHFEKIYRDRLYKEEIGREKKKLIHETYRLQGAIKDFLGLERTGTDESEGDFFPRGGIGE
jgi:hypothetical protein